MKRKSFTIYCKKKLSFSVSSWILLFSLPICAQQTYPSAGSFWVGGAGNFAPTDSLTIAQGLRTYQDVVRWEATHADFAAWTGLQYKQYVPNFVALDYMYTGQVNEDGFFLGYEPKLREIAIDNGHNYEDFFLHYQQDTWLNLTTVYENQAAWAGIPVGIGYTRSTNDTGVTLVPPGPWNADVFSGTGNGGYFYLADPEKFAEATFFFQRGGSNDGTIKIQYASAVDNYFNITAWSDLTSITSDSTHNFTQNGRIGWTPPADWKWAYNPVPNKTSQRYAYWLRVSPGQSYRQRPLVNNVQTRTWYHLSLYFGSGMRMSMMPPPNIYVKSLGWDSLNDLNHDGYLEDNEYANLLDHNATARFRYEARIPWNSIGNEPNRTDCFVNTANLHYRQDVVQNYTWWWAYSGYNGGYNDNFWVNVSNQVIQVRDGGLLANEGLVTNGHIQDEATNLAYNAGFNETLLAVKNATSTHWMGTNIYFINPYDYQANNVPFPQLAQQTVNLGVYDWYILEGTIYDSWSMVDAETFFGPFSGLSRIWHIAAFAKAGKKSAIMTRVGSNLLTPPSTQRIWERSQMGILAEYYLYHFPNLTSLQTIYENNSNITALTTTSNYYKAGVPANYAYQPHDMIAVDIGIPTGMLPQHGVYSPMPYTALVDSTALRNNTVIGNSISTSLNHPVYGSIPVLPTATYYLDTIVSAPYTTIVHDPHGHPFPAEVVLARQYSKGMVVFRTSFSAPTNYLSYSSDANVITVSLPGSYQRVNFDGTLGPLTNHVTLHGFEGAVFKTPVSNLTEPITSVNNSTWKDTVVNILVYPNPWISAENIQTQMTFTHLPTGSSMKIYSTSSGRLIKTFYELPETLHWDLTDEAGENIASGIYFYMITDRKNNASHGKICVIR